MRTFISLDLSKEAIEEIKRIQKELEKKNLFSGKFTEQENLHLTLKFLGEIDENTLNEVKNKLREIKFEGFKVGLGDIGVFSEDFIRIIWAKLDGKEVLELQKQVDDALEGLFEKERRFMSHLTIARVKSVRDKKELLKFLNVVKVKNIVFEVKDFNLMSSELFPGGPKYKIIEKFSL